MKSKVVIISLKDEQRKQRIISSQLSAQGIDYEFFDAIDYRGRDISELMSADELDTFRTSFTHTRLDPYPKAGEVGVYKSFLGVLEQFLATGEDALVICEDDAVFSPVFAQVVTGIEELDVGADLVSLGTLFNYDVGWHAMPEALPYYFAQSFDLPQGRTLFKCSTGSIGAQGVFVRRKWAEKNLEGLREILMPLDVRLFDGELGISSFWSINTGGDLVLQAVGGGSSIQPLGMGKSIIRIHPPLWRQLFPEWFAELWRALRVMRSRLGLRKERYRASS